MIAVHKAITTVFKPVVERFPRLARAYRRLRDHLDEFDPSIRTPWGFTLAGNPLMASGEFEPLETGLVRRLLGDSDVLVNVGANVGYYCCHARSLGKRVIAFEPIERNLRYLYRNLMENDWADSRVFPMALSSSHGLVRMFGGNTGASMIRGWAAIPDSYSTVVPMATMDSLLLQELRGDRALMIVDVEGAEKMVLEGGTGVLESTPRPTWLMEITLRTHQPEGVALNPHYVDTFALFLDRGYACYRAEQLDQPVLMPQIRAAAEGGADLGTHTFVFR